MNVVFDLGGVLIDWDPRYLFRKLCRDEAEVEHFLANICTRSWYVEHDSGRPFAEGVAELTAAHPEHASLIRAFDERWAETLGGAHEEAVAVLEALRARGVPLYGLTNWPADKFVHAQERFAFLGWLRGIVVSGREQVRKPDPRIYRILLERYQLVAAESVFIDDGRDNAEAATRAGMIGIHFESATQLRADLVRLGLL